MYSIVMHARCGGPAFKYDHAPTPGEKIRAKYVTTMSGHRIPDGAPGMTCGNCHSRIDARELAPGPMVYDMGNEEDMAVIYGDYQGEEHEHNH